MIAPHSRSTPALAASPGEEDPAALARRYLEISRLYPARRDPYALRALDLTLASIGLLLCAPLLTVAASLIRLSGPALYRGHRVGRGGRLFTIYKLRTLPPGAEHRLGARGGVELTQLTSTEATRLGRVLRASKLDELPQLWNVLRGEMSLVGPRPVRPAFFLQLIEDVPAYWQRLAVRPGLTGLAQLRMTRETSWEEKLSHDLEYIADRSLSLYLNVLLSTLWLWLSLPLGAARRELRLP
jgi:lipopolysaccharide/colanic/teichoic acid biosynthesis glycosyltransferase